MFNLIRRDLILQKKLLLIYLLMVVFFIMMDKHPAFTFLIASILIPFNTYTYDERAETNILLNSLPYTRKEIIASRYLGAIAYMGVGMAVASVALFVFNKPFTLTDMAIGGGLFLVFASFTFPMFYIFKPGYISTVVLISFLVLSAVGPSVFMFFAERLTIITHFIASLSMPVLYMGATAVIIVVYAVSWSVTTVIYQRKVF
ncbi:ABC-2 transporter permease [Alkalihalobacillus oceani]|uniref:ABC-2 transporter permease n=1 Tax=Halalkalibacter oceani TaxID=1653776 RepID=A0A9X2DVU3_9BACI|nr:ABC-2 transporter permease [Halalkalibacter oceani]MCM3716472.1 ABC-2 transporter permease [Halalkalibacter oceani]